MNLDHFIPLVKALFPGNAATDEQIKELGAAFYAHMQQKFKDKPELLEEMIDINPLKAFMDQDHMLKHKGYNPGFCLHLFEFVEDLQRQAAEKGITEDGEPQFPKIDINIWDDYYDDGYVPDGEKQDTFIYVEKSDEDGIDIDMERQILDAFLNKILDIHKNTQILSGVSFELKLRDSKNEYPNLVGTEHERFLIVRWEIRVENMTHAQRELLLTEIKKGKMFFTYRELNVYSES
jgi:hypothetical protein